MSKVATKPRKPAAKKAQPVAVRKPTWVLEDICDEIRDGKLMSEISRSRGLTRLALKQWLSKRPDWRAAVAEAREEAADTYAEMADEVLMDIQADSTPAEVTRARERAHQLRWKAKAMKPTVYGEKPTAAVTINMDPMGKLLEEIQHRGSRLPLAGIGVTEGVTDVEPR